MSKGYYFWKKSQYKRFLKQKQQQEKQQLYQQWNGIVKHKITRHIPLPPIRYPDQVPDLTKKDQAEPNKNWSSETRLDPPNSEVKPNGRIRLRQSFFNVVRLETPKEMYQL
ncbi:hypothetical protein C2G38_2026873 [Gigaspora rosea]|uniref:Uncharacterized protein n=1 Tax=Gigaspora rosea TaxID=44941 RepID=A0A397WDH5_9GLOM|nr:hypothetical protein C2G38_2026873 [Gigaspora rosea]